MNDQTKPAIRCVISVADGVSSKSAQEVAERMACELLNGDLVTHIEGDVVVTADVADESVTVFMEYAGILGEGEGKGKPIFYAPQVLADRDAVSEQAHAEGVPGVITGKDALRIAAMAIRTVTEECEKCGGSRNDAAEILKQAGRPRSSRRWRMNDRMIRW